MLQKEDLDKLTKVDRDRLLLVLSIIEEQGIKFPNKVLSETFNKSSGEISTYLNAKKPMSGNFYRDFMKVYGKKEEETVNKEVHTIDKNTTAKESELQALLNITQVYAESHLGLVRSHEILNQNHTTALAQNDELIKLVGKDKGQKINLSSTPNSQQATETFVRLLSESLASKYSLNQSDLRREIGSTLIALQGSKLSLDIRKNEKNEDN